MPQGSGIPLGSGGLDVDQVGHYQIEYKIAEGGFGSVYSAFDPRLKRRVAIKILHPHHASDPSRMSRFLREARSAARLQHQGIVQVHDVVETEGRMALVMEFVDGKTLDAHLKDHPELTLAHKLELAAQIADTLHVAHEAGIIHRDVKPANVLIEESGKAKLTDFSLARLLDSSMTQLTGENNVLGTPAYMSPEQCEGLTAVPQSDLYSLGIIIYEMATGELPFEAENYLALLRHHMDTPPTPIRLLKPTLPVVLEQVIMQCLAKSPQDRPASGAVLAAALRQIIENGLDEGTDPHKADTVELSKPDSPSKEATPTPAAIPATPAAIPSPMVTPTPSDMVKPMPTPADMPKPMPTPADMVKPMPTPLDMERPAAPLEEPVQQVPAPPRPKWHESKTTKLAVAAAAVVFLAVVGWLVFGSSTKDGLQLSVMPTETPLLDYVRMPDDNYSYNLHSKISGDGFTAHVLDLKSQTWNADKVKPPVWRHWLTIVYPDKMTNDKALMVFAEGLSTAEQPMKEVPMLLADLAVKTKSVVAILEGFPRDPIGFYDEKDQAPNTDRDEFAVATFARFLETGDTKWPIVCPIVKSVVRAMDAVQTYVTDTFSASAPVRSFVLTGAANGWAVWLTGSVDSRVAAIAPVQFDLLKIGDQIEHQVAFRGELSEFLSLFNTHDVMPELDTPNGRRLLHIIDPYEYRDRLTMPKLLLLSASSPLDSVDAASLFIDGLDGQSYLFYEPNKAPGPGDPLITDNEVPPAAPVPQPEATPATAAAEPQAQQPETAATEQSINDDTMMLLPQRTTPAREGAKDIRDTFRVFYHNMLVDKPMPKFSWNVTEDGTFSVNTEDPPTEVRLWVAESDECDFRFEKVGACWFMERLKGDETGLFQGKVSQRKGKYRAFYLELVYPSKLGVNYSLATPIKVLEPQENPISLSLLQESS